MNTSDRLVLAAVFGMSLAAMVWGHLNGAEETAALFGAIAPVMALTHLTLLSVLGGSSLNGSTTSSATTNPAAAVTRVTVVPPAQVNQ